MEKCEYCGKDGDLDFLKRCEPCFRNGEGMTKDSESLLSWRIKKSGYNTSVAHYDDIVHRKIGDGGKIYQERGRKSITI